MGLSVTAISNAEFAHKNEQWCGQESHYFIAPFSDKTTNLLLGGMSPGCYTSSFEDLSFSTGYGSWNHWCQILSVLNPVRINSRLTKKLGTKKVAEIFSDAPLTIFGFVQLSPVNGSVSSSFCKILYKQMSVMEKVIKKEIADSINDKKLIKWWLGIYKSLKRAFKIGSKKGFVIFH